MAYDHAHLVTGGVTLLGGSYASLLGQGAFDNSYVYMLVVFGAVATGLVLVAETALLRRLSRQGRDRRLCAVACALFLVYGLAESMWPSVVVNPTMFCLLWLGEDEGGGGHGA